MNTNLTFTGGCYCGGVRYQCEGPPLMSGLWTKLTWANVRILAALCVVVSPFRPVAKADVVQSVAELGLPKLADPIPAYYSDGAMTRAGRLQVDIRQMNAFFQESLGIQVDVTLAVLNSNHWMRVHEPPYGLPGIAGKPPVIFMPAHSGGFAFGLVMARKDAIPADALQRHLETNHTTIEAAADDFVDIVGFHELGHALCRAYGIRPGHRWLNEFVASYFAYAFVSERKPESKRVFDLLGRPSKRRPKNTTLADFERLYDRVDDYGWYQGMFESHIKELYPKLGIQFLKELKRQFPADGAGVPKDQVLEKLETIAPGFQAWAIGFQE